METLFRRFVNLWVEGQKAEQDRLREQFRIDQAFAKALGIEELLREITRGRGNSFVWSTPVFTSLYPRFYIIARTEIKKLADLEFIPPWQIYKPVQAFGEVITEPDGIFRTVEIYTAQHDSLASEDLMDRKVWIPRLEEACNHPSQRLVRLGAFLAGRDAYDPFF